jgi:hypothetical protein
MEVPLAEEFDIVEVSRFTTVGYIQPGWMLIKPLSGIVEQDQEGLYFFISNEGLGLYAVGFTQEEALADFKTSLIDNYQLLESRVRGEPDLELLFQEYQEYLKIEGRERLRKTSHSSGDEPANSSEGTAQDNHRLDLAHGLPSSEGVAPQAPYETTALPVTVKPDQPQREAPETSAPLSLNELGLLLSLLAEYRAKPSPDRAGMDELERLERKLKHLAVEAAGRDRLD